MSEFTPRRVHRVEDLRPYDVVRSTTERRGIKAVLTFTYAGWSPARMADITTENGVIGDLPFEDGVVEVIGQEWKGWPEGGTSILVTETHDPLGEADLPKTPFVAIVTGEHFTASRDGSWIHDWSKSFATEWQELVVWERPSDGYWVEVKSE